jgi:hypothetical protein
MLVPEPNTTTRIFSALIPTIVPLQRSLGPRGVRQPGCRSFHQRPISLSSNHQKQKRRDLSRRPTLSSNY